MWFICQVDEELDALISHIKLQEGNTEFWKRRFLGEDLPSNYIRPVDTDEPEPSEISDDIDGVEDAAKEVEDDEVDADEEEVEQAEEEVEPAENQVDRVKDKEVEAKKPLQMIGVQLLKDSDEPRSSSKKMKKSSSRKMVEV